MIHTRSPGRPQGNSIAMAAFSPHLSPYLNRSRLCYGGTRAYYAARARGPFAAGGAFVTEDALTVGGHFALLPRTWYPSPSLRAINFLSRSCMYARLTVSGEMPSCLPSDCVEGSEAPGLSLPLLIESFTCRNTCAFSVSSVLRLSRIDSFATMCSSPHSMLFIE